MNPKLITGPTVEPLTLAECKDYLGITDDVQDAEITRRISSAREYAENYTSRVFITQTWELALDAFPAVIYLKKGPVQSITSVKYYDTSNVQQTMVEGTDYQFDDRSNPESVLPETDVDWPLTYDRKNAVLVQYVAGFGDTAADVPETIRQAIAITVGQRINFQAAVESGLGIQMVPRAVDQLLFSHRVMHA